MSGKMKRVKILTFTYSMNYGALLQAFALREYVSSLGEECETVNYFSPSMTFSQVTGWRKARSIVWNLTFARLFRKKLRKKRTQGFRRDLLQLAETPLSSCEELTKLNDSTDIFIVGSDQVWNPGNNANDPAFLLAFTDKKKVAYAASFGSNAVSKRFLIENRALFQAFDRISVREESGAKALSEEIGIQAQVVCDPVFLLEKKDWIQKLKLVKKDHEKYVLCYVMPGNAEAVARIYSLARQLAEKLCIPVIVVGEKPYKRNHGVFTYDHDCGPTEFVDYIRNAEFVVTNSFHGTAFSVIFRKDFYTVMKREPYGRNIRMENLLCLLNLSERGVYTDTAIESAALSATDYSKTENILCEYIDNSKRFLKETL